MRQLVRSGTSVGANFVEAQCAASRKDFANFLRHSLKSGRESEYWLEVIARSAPVDGEKIRQIKTELNELVRILYAIVAKLARPIASERRPLS